VPALPAPILTERLVLRRWCAADEEAMVAINRDPEVTRYLNRPIDAAAVRSFLSASSAHWARHGFGPWALEGRSALMRGRLVGFAGVAFPAFLPEVAHRPELGWRLARDVWGRGLATEAAAAALADADRRLGLTELIAIIHPDNRRSQRVARKLGMSLERSVHNPVLARDVDLWSRSLGRA